MGLCKTSNVFIFSVINASDLKFRPRSYSSCVYRMMRFRGSNEDFKIGGGGYLKTLVLDTRAKAKAFKFN